MSESKNGGHPRIGHTMIRVRDLKQSLDFYTRLLGMRVLRSTDYPSGKFTNTLSATAPKAPTRRLNSLTIGSARMPTTKATAGGIWRLRWTMSTLFARNWNPAVSVSSVRRGR